VVFIDSCCLIESFWQACSLCCLKAEFRGVCKSFWQLIVVRTFNFTAAAAVLILRCCCRVVALLQQYITLTLYQQQAITPGIEAATRLLGLLENASSKQSLLDMAEFYNDAVNEPDFNIKEDYKRWNSVGFNIKSAKSALSWTVCRLHALCTVLLVV
jgi:hypothetical protein